LLDERDVFHQASRKSRDFTAQQRRVGFEGLHPAKKRWCFYWWYSLNVCGWKGRDRLPACIIAHVRSAYPNPKNVPYLGYKKSCSS
jgi:hypothetical protein